LNDQNPGENNISEELSEGHEINYEIEAIQLNKIDEESVETSEVNDQSPKNSAHN